MSELATLSNSNVFPKCISRPPPAALICASDSPLNAADVAAPILKLWPLKTWLLSGHMEQLNRDEWVNCHVETDYHFKSFDLYVVRFRTCLDRSNMRTTRS